MARDRMSFSALTLHFIYPFSVDVVQLLNNWDAIAKSAEKLSTADTNNALTDSYLPSLAPLAKESMPPIPIWSHKVSVTTSDGKVTQQANLSSEVILRRNGSASCVLKLWIPIEKNLSVREALKFLLLGDPVGTISLSKTDTAQKQSRLPPNGRLYNYYEATPKKAETVVPKIKRIIRYGDFQQPHSPFVLTDATLSERTPYHYLHQLTGDEPGFSDLASMLIRTYKPATTASNAIDLKYTGFPEPFPDMKAAILSNLYPFPHLYANIHFRSCLVIQAKKYADPQFGDYARKYVKVLREIIVAECAQWYLYLRINADLDELLEKNAKLTNKFLGKRLQAGVDDSMEALIKSIIDLRTTAALSLKDSLGFSHSAGSISHLVRRTTQLFNMDMLEAAIRGKLDALNRMYFDLRELYRLQVIKKIEAEND